MKVRTFCDLLRSFCNWGQDRVEIWGFLFPGSLLDQPGEQPDTQAQLEFDPRDQKTVPDAVRGERLRQKPMALQNRRRQQENPPKP
jgi:hypothetical protein